MNDAQLVTLEQVPGFLAVIVDLDLTPLADPAARYGHIKSVLKQFKYPLHSKADRGVTSRPQLTRLIAQYQRSGRLVQRLN